MSGNTRGGTVRAMAWDGHRTFGSNREEAGQASLMMLAVIAAVLAGTLVHFAFGNALGAKGRHQRAADLAAMSAAQVMRDLYPRLFEPPFLEPDVPNPRHLEREDYLELARAAAVRGARRNGVGVRPQDVRFPGAGLAPTRPGSPSARALALLASTAVGDPKSPRSRFHGFAKDGSRVARAPGSRQSR